MKFVRKITRELFEPKRPLDGKRLVVDRDAGTISARVYSFGQNYSTNDKIKAPRNVNVEAAHIGPADDIEPGFKVGNLCMHIMHAGESLTAAQAAEWYNDTKNAVARGRYSVDDEGVRFDGTLYDDIEEAKLERLTASAPSGDWRWKANSMVRKPQDMETEPCDFVGSCMVNIPGFSDTYSQSPMTPMRLVASAESDEILLTDIEDEVVEDTTKNSATANGATCGDGVCCGGVCKEAAAETVSAEEQVDRESLVAAATLLAKHASVLGIDEDTVRSLTAASSVPDDSGDSLAKVREDLNSLAQILHDAIMSL